METLTVIPEDIFRYRIKEVDNINHIWKCSCDCGIVSVPFHPYAWDPENNEVVYMGICPKCNKVVYVRD